jgi:hypothetical protein
MGKPCVVVAAGTSGLKTGGRNGRDRAIKEFIWLKAAVRTLEIYEVA